MPTWRCWFLREETISIAIHSPTRCCRDCLSNALKTTRAIQSSAETWISFYTSIYRSTKSKTADTLLVPCLIRHPEQEASSTATWYANVISYDLFCSDPNEGESPAQTL